MRRVRIGERPDWRMHAARNGFHFHTLADQPYWDESHAYAFTLDEIEEEIEAPSAELHALCLDFVDRAVEDEHILAGLRIPRCAWDAVRDSWHRRDPSLYGRLDFAYGGDGPAKLLEYNADTPTALYETAVFQWLWLEDLLANGRLARGADQYNAVHERLIARFRAMPGDGTLALTAFADAPEDRGTVAYLEDCASQAGLACRFLDLGEIGLDAAGCFIDRRRTPISRLFKLYPWEWAFADTFGVAVARTPTRFLEPPWKAILSNKGLLPYLYAREPNHPNLLPAYFETDPARAALGTRYVRKPLYSREGANIQMVEEGIVVAQDHGPYGAEGYIRQALAPVPCFDGRRPLVGSWIVGDAAAGLCIRESAGPITTNAALFVPHYIEAA
ncbi:glutathionylspermidine synthase family protein [Methylobacterium sp. J-068]|uniref:glutathionylspermidine synthase family protein n=1 Tax=Methylobacterium sp. J-068 TaxID=2836649 RepID=UPI001FB9498A|nr:glutathionylspermidine synthase family protein [Methylobacterium sp. J-068]MCJ2034556.1 glutathionylspermidine synthase family protein [Methylobacterium sp. J-068]